VWAPDATNSDDTDDWDDLPAVKATGGGAGGAYTWEVIAGAVGAGTIQLVSPSFTGVGAPTPPGPNDDTVRILGSAPSATLNDAQIKATWRSADGTQECEDMIELTVVFVSLSFRPNEPYSVPREVWTGFPGGPSAPEDGSNDIPPDPFFGAPLLGAIRPGAPPQAQGFFKNNEISATISPCIDGLGSAADFKRLRQGFEGIVLTVNGQPRFFTDAQAFPNHCPPPTSCDDDTKNGQVYNLDEDLIFDAKPACRVFVIDTPGVASGASCAADQIEFDVQPFSCFNFTEWLSLDGYRASRTLDWSASTGISCGPGGLWQEGHDWVSNRVGPSHKPFPAIPPAGALPVRSGPSQVLAAASTPPMPTKIRQRELASGTSDSVRLRAAIHKASSEHLVVRLRAMQEANALMRQGVVVDIDSGNELITALANGDPHNVGGSFVNYMRFAIGVLGQLGREDAARAIIPYIGTQFPGSVDSSSRTITPAVRALCQSGLAAVGPILEHPGSAPDADWRRMTYVLGIIDKRSPIVRQAMQTMLDAQRWFAEVEAAGAAPQPSEAERARRTRVRERLLDFLSTPEPDRPRPVISALPTNGAGVARLK